MCSTFYRFLKLGLGIILPVTLGVSACDFVDPGSDLGTLRNLDQTHLPIYMPNQYIEYDIIVNGTNVPSNAQGKLRVEWSTPENFVDSNPLDGSGNITPIDNLLKETTTLEYSGGDTVTVIRYITQDRDENSPTYGAISLHAFNSFSATDKFSYVHSSSSALQADFPSQTMIFPAPLLDDTFNLIPAQLDFDIDYYVLPNCGLVSSPDTCDLANQRYEETIQLSKAKITSIESAIGYFEAIQIPYGRIGENTSVGRISDLDVSDMEKLRLDIKASCGNPTDLLIEFYGDVWVYPKIGIIRYENVCLPSTPDTMWFSGTISSTNIDY